ncbi:DUF1697 domain-containing protein [Pararhodobacter sp.]|uniref:DUF1697 domain-containing protein n=1 Tax=Pararhodobacter sp. TaxID=2127056 RepID=UPI002FDD21E0
MEVFVALLRAVNVGGTGKLPMTELRALCTAAGFENTRTYIQSGNVVFRTGQSREAAQTALETRLREHCGKAVATFLRDAASMQDVLARNPFPTAAPDRVAILFLNGTPPPDLLLSAKGRRDEQIEPGLQEVFIHYPSGMGRSRLRLAVMDHGTARNLNTIRKLAAMAAEAR